MQDVYFYVVANGCVSAGYVRVYVCANTDEEAERLAKARKAGG